MFQPACICDLLFISNCCTEKNRIELFPKKKVFIPSVEKVYIFRENLLKSYKGFNVAPAKRKQQRREVG
jgi:hypothetical protein